MGTGENSQRNQGNQYQLSLRNLLIMTEQENKKQVLISCHIVVIGSLKIIFLIFAGSTELADEATSFCYRC